MGYFNYNGSNKGIVVGESHSNASGFGYKSIAIGYKPRAFGNGAIAIGESCNDAVECTSADGAGSIAIGWNALAFGFRATAFGANSKAMGHYSLAFPNSNADGYGSLAACGGTANKKWSVAIGEGTYAGMDHGCSVGRYNINYGNTLLNVGNGTGENNRSSAFFVTSSGQAYASAFRSSGADYAEYFEWADGNAEKEDRVGRFVTFDETDTDKIKVAGEGDYILGIVSGNPSVIGNSDMDWQGRYVTDDFGRRTTVKVETKETEVDPSTKEEKEVKSSVVTTFKQNPDYNPEVEYVSRDQRAEWDAIGMLGVLAVYDDGTCTPGGYCKCGKDGVATKAAEGYRVIKRVSENVVKVVFR